MIAGGDIVLDFIWVALGGPLVGFIIAKITLFWLSRIFNDAIAEITITLASTYITYYIGRCLPILYKQDLMFFAVFFPAETERN